ncbi:MAG TPA: DNA-binding domain-containing protein [Candidatus Polarisedimenticolia bacterium]|nr:DNA-binding domain-containing protein [Candidatus Polarisedimenticolia bacterium]
MTALPILQGEFQDFLLDRPNEFSARVKRSTKADEATLLKIYRNAYGARLVEVLGNDYPALKAMMGGAPFAAMGKAYIAAYPSRHPSARWVGGKLAPFLRDDAGYAKHPALAEMAAFEWAQAGAFDAHDIEPATFEQLAAIPVESWPGLRFRFAPSLRRLTFAFDVPSLWQAINAGKAGDAPLSAEPREAEWLIWRAGLEVRFRPLEAEEAWAIDAAAGDADFAALCEGICRWVDPEQAAFKAAALIKGWLDSALIDDAQVDKMSLSAG